jgi:hypothetical protein
MSRFDYYVFAGCFEIWGSSSLRDHLHDLFAICDFDAAYDCDTVLK